MVKVIKTVRAYDPGKQPLKKFLESQSLLETSLFEFSFHEDFEKIRQLNTNIFWIFGSFKYIN